MKARSEGPHTSPDVHRDGARGNAREMRRCSPQWCWLAVKRLAGKGAVVHRTAVPAALAALEIVKEHV